MPTSVVYYLVVFRLFLRLGGIQGGDEAFRLWPPLLGAWSLSGGGEGRTTTGRGLVGLLDHLVTSFVFVYVGLLESIVWNRRQGSSFGDGMEVATVLFPVLFSADPSERTTDPLRGLVHS